MIGNQKQLGLKAAFAIRRKNDSELRKEVRVDQIQRITASGQSYHPYPGFPVTMCIEKRLQNSSRPKRSVPSFPERQ